MRDLPSEVLARWGSETRVFCQQNTFTGKLTPAMLRDVLSKAKDAAGL